MVRRAGAITIRDLARQTSAVIDRVREEDSPVIITRNGIPVATIQPLEVDPWARQPGRPIPAMKEEEIDIDTFELTEVMKEILRDIGSGFQLNRTISRTGVDVKEALAAFGHMELKGLTTKTRTGYEELTRTGCRVFEELFGES